MIKGIIPALSLCGFSLLFADPVKMEETVVTATLNERSAHDVPASIQTVDISDIRERRLPRTMPEVFKEMNGVLVQKTGHAQGSPFIRGFTSYHNVFLIDGIKLNNSVFRSGPNQYWGTVDPFGLEKVELLSASASSLYGSDAVGGTVQAFTKSLGYSSDKNAIQGGFFSRLAAAEDSRIFRLDIGGGLSEKTDLSLGGTFKDFGDLKSGAGDLPNTGYDETAFDLKLNHYISETSYFTIAHSRGKIDDAWRTHKTTSAVPYANTSVGSDLHRMLDQERALSYIQFHHVKSTYFFDDVSLNLSIHTQEQYRDRLKKVNDQSFEGFEAETLGLWARFNKDIGKLSWSYGVERYSDSVDTHRTDVKNGTTKVVAQGPFGNDSGYDTTGVYAQLDTMITDTINLLVGTRYTKTELSSAKVLDENSSITSINNDADAIVSNIRGLWFVNENINAYAGVAQSFRAPNLSDLTARLDGQSGRWFEVPVTNGLDPEKFLTFDLGLKYSSDDLQAGISLYRTDGEDMITRVPTGAVVSGESVVTKVNGKEMFVHGIDLWFEKDISDSLLLSFKVAWMDGEQDYVNTSGSLVNEPLSRMLPLTSQIAFKYEKPGSKWWSEVRATIASKQDDLALNDIGDTSRIPPGGTPGYEVLTIRGGVKLNDNVSFSLAIENLFDENYRVHGSGLNEPGRNGVLATSITF
jgi:hemoglobin/transferrin/lactoferrin receptor protein